MPKAVPGQNGPRSSYFAISRRGGPVGQNVKVADNHPGYRGNLFIIILGPLAPGNCDFPLSARCRDFSKCQRPSWAKMAQNPRVSRFSARGGPVGQNVNCQKVADNHPGQRGNFFSSFSGPLALGNCVFLFSDCARDFSKCPRPKTGQYH